MDVRYDFTEREVKELLSSMVILIDTRERENRHITHYFDRNGILYKSKKLNYGDYAAYLPSNEALGIQRGLYFSVAIERKNSVDELANTIKERTRFENELIRAQHSPFLLIIEDKDGYERIIRGEYKSQYNSKALLGSLKSFEARYGFQTIFIAPNMVGNYIYYHLYYMVRDVLKRG